MTPTAAQVLRDWSLQPAVVGPLVVAAGLYGWGMVRVRHRHPTRPWRLTWAAAFAAGLVVIAMATLSAAGAYGATFFWVHMIQHLLLIMVAPALLIFGRPWILLLHSVGNPWHRRVRRLLRSRVVSVLTSPLFSVPVYAGVVVGTHLSSFNNLVITNRWAEAAELAGYLVSGYLYLLSGFGDEPIRTRLSAVAKMVMILISMPIDTFTGIALLMTDTQQWPAYTDVYPGWGPDPVTDQHWGGMLMWVGGDTIMISLIIVAAVPWLRGRAGARGRLRWVERARAAAYGSSSATIDDDAALGAYNAWLATMAARDARPPSD